METIQTSVETFTWRRNQQNPPCPEVARYARLPPLLETSQKHPKNQDHVHALSVRERGGKKSGEVCPNMCPVCVSRNPS
eukprot:1988773-Rhodomonas_salina.8